MSDKTITFSISEEREKEMKRILHTVYDALREKVAKLWAELNGVEITPEMINCTGCRIDGVKTPYCESLCPIRQCAMERKVSTCGTCAEVRTCEKAGMILGNNKEARQNLGLERGKII